MKTLKDFVVKTNEYARESRNSTFSKGDLMKMAYGENYTNVDSALPQGMLEEEGIDNSEYWHYVMDYNGKGAFGQLTDLFDVIALKNPTIEVYNDMYELTDTLSILDAAKKYKNQDVLWQIKRSDKSSKYAKGSTVKGNWNMKMGTNGMSKEELTDVLRALGYSVKYGNFKSLAEAENFKSLAKKENFEFNNGVWYRNDKYAKGSTIKGGVKSVADSKTKIEIKIDEEGRKIATRTLVKANSKGEKITYELTVGLQKSRKRGWFETYATDEEEEEYFYSEGGLWIEGGKITDYDGVYELSEKLKPLMSALNLNSVDVYEEGGSILAKGSTVKGGDLTIEEGEALLDKYNVTDDSLDNWIDEQGYKPIRPVTTNWFNYKKNNVVKTWEELFYVYLSEHAKGKKMAKGSTIEGETNDDLNEAISTQISKYNQQLKKLRSDYRGEYFNTSHEGFLAIDEKGERISDWKFYSQEFSENNLKKMFDLYPNAKQIIFSTRLNGRSDENENESGYALDHSIMEFDVPKKYAKGGNTIKFDKLPKNRQADKKYTHFAVGNADGKILNGWDYKGYDAEELSSEKKHYYYNDMDDMDYKKSEYTIQTAKKLISKGINPYDFDNWRKIDYSTNESSYDTKFPERKMANGGDVSEANKKYKVVKIFRKSGRKEILEKNLTRAEAMRVVNSYPNSNTSMVVFYEMFKDGGNTDLGYSNILNVLKSKIDDSIDEMPMDYENAYNFKGEEVEHESRDGFIPYTNGGYQAIWFEYLDGMWGAGRSLPTKQLDDEMNRQIDYNLDSAKDSFVNKYPEIVEELGLENIDYNSLYEAGYGEEAEMLSSAEMGMMGEDTIMMQVSAFYYSPENSRAKDGKHTIRLFGDVNLESPYHRAGNLDDSYEHEFTFDSIEELQSEMDKGVAKILSWFNGDMYNESTAEMKIRRMANGGGVEEQEVDVNYRNGVRVSRVRKGKGGGYSALFVYQDETPIREKWEKISYGQYQNFSRDKERQGFANGGNTNTYNYSIGGL